MKDKKIYKMLSIAGSDNTCGAGIQADIKTCQALKTYCLSCITSVTSQNSEKFFKIIELPNNFIESQIKTITKDYKLDCIKIGLINSVSQAKVICKILMKLKYKVPIVVDPIFKSSTNKEFNNSKNFILINEIISKINPVFTPNLNEAKTLLKLNYYKKIDTSEIIKNFIKTYKAKVVITDGGHKNDYCEDYFVDENEVVKKIMTRKIFTKNTHGSGCTFSSALAINLAKGFTLGKSVELAKYFTKKCILNAPKFKLSYGPVGHLL